MAGYYADVPGTRISLDTAGVYANVTLTNDTIMGTYTQAQLKNLCGDSSAVEGVGFSNYPSILFRHNFIFPEPYDFIGLFANACHFYSSTSGSFSGGWYSTDSTNGIDGTWTSFTLSGMGVGATSKVLTRTNIYSLALTNVVGIRLAVTNGASSGTRQSFTSVHLYGGPSSTSKRIEIWHPTLSQRAGAYLDFGDAQRSSTITKQVRVKNIAATETANDVVVSIETIVDTTPTNTSAYTVSLDDSTYSTTVTIPTLTAGSTQNLYVRRATQSGAVTGLWSSRISAIATSWA